MKYFLILLTLWMTPKSYADNQSLTIFAASSLASVLPEVVKEWSKAEASKTNFQFESSGKLAKQIELGAPADLFFSADESWIKYLREKNKLDFENSHNLLSNRLVVIIPKDIEQKNKSIQFLNENWVKHIALANENVPAGKYGREVLQKNNILPLLKDKIISGENVKETLTWVSKKEAEAGIVFYTDSLIQDNVKIAYEFKKDDHSPIIYSLALIKDSKQLNKAKDFFRFCKSQRAKDIFSRFGFEILP